MIRHNRSYLKHLLAQASVMSAPYNAVISAKILYPESERFEEKLEINKEELGSN